MLLLDSSHAVQAAHLVGFESAGSNCDSVCIAKPLHYQELLLVTAGVSVCQHTQCISSGIAQQRPAAAA
jgi:hypothetical protein